MRGDGGYVIAPPSVHPSGETYRWKTSARILEVELPQMPEWLLGLAIKSKSTTNENDGIEALTGFDLLHALNGVPEGERNDQIFRAACSFRGTNTARKVALQACSEAAAKCIPPFPSNAAAREIVMRAYRVYRTDDRPKIEIQPGRRPWMVDRAEEVILDHQRWKLFYGVGSPAASSKLTQQIQIESRFVGRMARWC